MIPHFSLPELFIIGSLALIFFGTNKLPEAARSIGKAVKGFKEELKDTTESLNNSKPVVDTEVVEKTSK
ncbi:MAG: twin-arginine translocase TatA/TatE family subunit [candidate division SR1 bacterium]|nr:twin-arginine translocase TatA/TatE family subunit [candidate division SR1 bacterium]